MGESIVVLECMSWALQMAALSSICHVTKCALWLQRSNKSVKRSKINKAKKAEKAMKAKQALRQCKVCSVQAG